MIKIGIDIGGTTIKLGAVKDGGEIVYRDTAQTPHEVHGLAVCMAGLLKKARLEYPDAPFAVSMAGAFNAEGNFDANQLGFENVPLRQEMEAAVGEKVRIENDGICALMAEYVAGSLKGHDPALMITLGTGVGGGVIIGGRPLRGRGGIHAELGHMITHADGKKCSCGQTGCWECYASATALSEMAGGMKPREVIDRVREGEMADIWEKYCREIAQGLIGLCSIFSPEIIAVGGGISNAGDMVIDGIRRAMCGDEGYQQYYSDIKVVQARYQNDAGIIGAAAIVE